VCCVEAAETENFTAADLVFIYRDQDSFPRGNINYDHVKFFKRKAMIMANFIKSGGKCCGFLYADNKLLPLKNFQGRISN
jgi:hypothetical protein